MDTSTTVPKHSPRWPPSSEADSAHPYLDGHGRATHGVHYMAPAMLVRIDVIDDTTRPNQFCGWWKLWRDSDLYRSLLALRHHLIARRSFPQRKVVSQDRGRIDAADLKMRPKMPEVPAGQSYATMEPEIPEKGKVPGNVGRRKKALLLFPWAAGCDRLGRTPCPA